MARHQGSAPEGEVPDATTPERPIAIVQLITAGALAVSTLVAVTAVSIGIARADVLGAHTGGNTTSLAIAVFVGVLLTGMGGLTALITNERRD